MANWIFNPPGNLKDFKNPKKWHNHMVGEAQAIVKTLVAAVLNKDEDKVTDAEIVKTAPMLSYIDPTQVNIPSQIETVGIAPWGAFPRAVERGAPWPFPDQDPNDVSGILRASETLGDDDFRAGHFEDNNGNKVLYPVRHRQDEYLEWVVRKDKAGKITKVIFVAEGYDYFEALFQADPAQVVDIYKEFTEVNSITKDDLIAKNGIIRITQKGKTTVVKAGEFNPRNQLNINPGIVHLSHRANSLSAEVNLAGVSGIARKGVDGLLLPADDAELLLCCSEGGNPNRNSDPLIALQAYTQVVGGFHYTLADPVGLYISGIEEDRLQLPDGSKVPSDWWKVVRGEGKWNDKDSRILRLELEVPASEKITISDLLVDGDPVVYGAQIAKLLSVHLFVSRWKRADGGPGPVVNCICTCCRKIGSLELVLTEDGNCGAGFTLAFPGLIPPVLGQAKQTLLAAAVTNKASGSGRKKPF